MASTRHTQQASSRSRESVGPVLLACVIAFLLAGCGTGARSGGGSAAGSATLPAYPLELVTPKQQLIGRGARLVVLDGCAACHLTAAGQGVAPSFEHLAGHRITLADGRRVLVDEQFLREALLDRGASPMKGYDPEPMLAALRRVRLNSKPEQVAALAAFIEEIGPESPESPPSG
jgi:Cytochrome c